MIWELLRSCQEQLRKMLLFMQNTHWRIALHLSQWADSHYLFRFIWQLFSEELIKVNYSNIMFIYRLTLFTLRFIFTFLQILPTTHVLNLVTSLHPHHHEPCPHYHSSLRWIELPGKRAFQLCFYLLHLYSTVPTMLFLQRSLLGFSWLHWISTSIWGVWLP